jgi:hypothetical protein
MKDRTSNPDEFYVGEGREWVLNRCSTKRPRIYGPITVIVTKWADGGYDYKVEDAE